MTEQDINVVRNDGHTFDLTFKDGDAVAIDITGWTVWMTAKESRSNPDSEAIFQKTVTSHSDATNGITQVVLTPTDLSCAGSFYYDIQTKNVAGDIQTVIGGFLNITEDVTLAS